MHCFTGLGMRLHFDGGADQPPAKCLAGWPFFIVEGGFSPQRKFYPVTWLYFIIEGVFSPRRKFYLATRLQGVAR